ncbi:phage tail protein [Nesterenkonia sp. HG001]|uniref:phage tail protein n=1 Tax=Nesterenkonia sp. HG001 TaxID=2983207 RepID=UPI002AC494E8|nr:phage tail protein [Nesterenkonia sp. HG001]MDZ5077862.1 phage tail protein [Nesterenkonia sp. HG001]
MPQWSDRFAYSGEVPLSWPDLNPVALQRIAPAGGSLYYDAVDDTRTWERIPGGANDGYTDGYWGLHMGVNTVDPAEDQGRFELAHFDGLWPTGGRLLLGLWVRQQYTMSFNPLMSTRAGADPVVYLSTSGSSGRIRHQVYDDAGDLVLDQYEDHPWVQTTSYQFVGMLVDYDAQTSQMISVERAGRRAWTGPVRDLSGAPATSSSANLDIFDLRTANYWTGGAFDEALVAHPGPGFDLEAFAEAMAHGQWANGQDEDHLDTFEVTEDGVTATEAGTLHTGAEQVTWEKQPVVQGAPDGATPYLSEDDGDTWEEADPAELPETFDGLMRWEIPLDSGDEFTGITLTIPEDPPPELESIGDITLRQGELHTEQLEFQVSGDPEWSATADRLVDVNVTEDGTLTVAAGFEVDTGSVTITLADELGRTASRSFTATVEAREWEEGDPPVYPYAPVILWDDDQPAAVVIDPTEAVVTTEVNGEHTFELSIPASHRHAHLIRAERIVEVAGERYWIRRISTARTGRQPVLEIYAEARFYELATAGEVTGQDYTQTSAGQAMEDVLEGTGWSVGVANVTTRRSYELEDTNPLEALRTIQEQHGGDLVFNNADRTVSLVTREGRDRGVSFFAQRGLSDVRRVEDTTSLVTRIYARNEDGTTIAEVNDGVPYVEDFSYTDDVREATLTFDSGTSPHAMLDRALDAVARRSRPDVSYELTVSDMSAVTDRDIDRFDVGDLVTVIDPELGVDDKQRIVAMEYNVIEPWRSEVTLSAKLRELGSEDAGNASSMTTGSDVSTFDLVPFNLLLNSRFDQGLAHWASSGAEIVETGQGTGDYAVRFAGSGERWIEQTIAPDNREDYAFSFDIDTDGPSGWTPDLTVEAVVEYEDGSTDTIELELS